MLALVFLCSPADSAVVMSVNPGGPTVLLGDSVSVDVNVSGLGNGTAPSIGVFDLLLEYDPSKLTFNGLSHGTGLDVLSLGSFQSSSAGSNAVSVFELSFDSAQDLNTLQPDSFLLFSVNFSGSGLGVSPLTLTINSVGDADGVDLPITVENSSVTVLSTGSPTDDVPEPRTVMLVGSVLIASVLRKRSLTARSAPRCFALPASDGDHRAL